MRIDIVGGGPAGLTLAIRMMTLDPRHRIRVFEREPEDATFGWGVVFSGRTLGFLAQTDAQLHAGMTAQAETWERVEVVRPDGRLLIAGNPYAGVGRLRLLQALRARARALGVELRFEAPVEDPARLADVDLLVGADGVHSTVRERWREEFRPRIDHGAQPYIWLGTPRRFEGLTLIFRPHATGLYIAHAYRYSAQASTFVVEAEPGAVERAGLAGAPIEATLRHLERVFEPDLGGAPLWSNRSRWIRFVLVRTERWSRGHVVLLGDACHTAHFSIGSGTKLAMEDAVALAETLSGRREVEAALAEYEARRRPKVEEFQRAAQASRVWFERAHRRMGWPLWEFAYDLMRRSGRVDDEDLARRDPSFMEAVRRARGS